MASFTFKDEARDQLKALDGSVRSHFWKHILKISRLPPRRHLKHGRPYFVDNVGQGRITYGYEDGLLIINGCFATHKDYDKWRDAHR